MQLETGKNVKVEGPFRRMRIGAEQEGFIAQILREKIYTNSIQATVRELISNAADAVKKAGSGQIKVQIDSTYFTVIDTGIGLSPDTMERVFSLYGKSDKRDSDEQIGGFGLGAKAPLAYSDVFFIDSNFAGERNSYQVFVDDTGTGGIQHLGMSLPTYPHGTSVRVPIQASDFEEFVLWSIWYGEFVPDCEVIYDEAQLASKYRVNKSKNERLVGFARPKYNDSDDRTVRLHSLKLDRNMREFLERGNIYSFTHYRQSQIILNIGGVPFTFPAPHSSMVPRERADVLVLTVDNTSAFDISVSRESLPVNEKNKAAVKAAFEKLVESVADYYVSDLRSYSGNKSATITDTLTPYDYWESHGDFVDFVGHALHVGFKSDTVEETYKKFLENGWNVTPYEFSWFDRYTVRRGILYDDNSNKGKTTTSPSYVFNGNYTDLKTVNTNLPVRDLFFDANLMVSSNCSIGMFLGFREILRAQNEKTKVYSQSRVFDSHNRFLLSGKTNVVAYSTRKQFEITPANQFKTVSGFSALPSGFYDALPSYSYEILYPNVFTPKNDASRVNAPAGFIDAQEAHAKKWKSIADKFGFAFVEDVVAEYNSRHNNTKTPYSKNDYWVRYKSNGDKEQISGAVGNYMPGDNEMYILATNPTQDRMNKFSQHVGNLHQALSDISKHFAPNSSPSFPRIYFVSRTNFESPALRNHQFDIDKFLQRYPTALSYFDSHLCVRWFRVMAEFSQKMRGTTRFEYPTWDQLFTGNTKQTMKLEFYARLLGMSILPLQTLYTEIEPNYKLTHPLNTIIHSFLELERSFNVLSTGGKTLDVPTTVRTDVKTVEAIACRLGVKDLPLWQRDVGPMMLGLDAIEKINQLIDSLPKRLMYLSGSFDSYPEMDEFFAFWKTLNLK